MSHVSFVPSEPRRHAVVIVVTLALAALLAAAASADEVLPTDARGLRSYDGGFHAAYVISACGIVPPGSTPTTIQDRSILHFDARGLASGAHVTLDVWAINLDAEPENGGNGQGGIEVYGFRGDGVVSLDEWDAGNHLGAWTANHGIYLHHFQLDVTNIAVDMGGVGFLSFRLSGSGQVRWFVGAAWGNGLPDPVLRIDSTTATRSSTWGQLKARYR